LSTTNWICLSAPFVSSNAAARRATTGALGTDEFTRIRMGIYPEHPVRDGARYVLAEFKKAQYEAVDLLLDTAADAVTAIVTDGAQAAMNRFNRKDKPEKNGAEADK